MCEILDYSETVEESSERVEENYYSPIAVEIQTSFFADVHGKCKYCQSKLQTPINDVRNTGGGFDEIDQIHACYNCGWWYARHSEGVYLGEGDTLIRNRLNFAVLRKYEERSLDVPLASLRNALQKRSDILYKIHPTKLEQLVGDVLKDHFGCDVTHVGRSGDGGIDLYLIDGEQQWVVQVKQRQGTHAREGVQVIRELVGAMAISQQRRGIFVTTAAKFTRGARNTATKAAFVGAVERIDLIDMAKFIDILKLTSNKLHKPWERP